MLYMKNNCLNVANSLTIGKEYHVIQVDVTVTLNHSEAKADPVTWIIYIDDSGKIQRLRDNVANKWFTFFEK